MDLKHVCIYHFSNDCEMENAIVGGLHNAHGDYVILLDMAFHSQTELIEKLYLETQKNFDIVVLQYRKRGGSRIRKILLRLFYRSYKSTPACNWIIRLIAIASGQEGPVDHTW